MILCLSKGLVNLFIFGIPILCVIAYVAWVPKGALKGVGGFFLFFIMFFVSAFIMDSFRISIIRVGDDNRHERVNYHFTRPDLEDKEITDLEFGKSYIINESSRALVIEPVTYSAYPLLGSGSPDEGVEVIMPGQMANPSNMPDYYFRAPETITIRTKKFESKNSETKWLLRYLNE